MAPKLRLRWFLVAAAALGVAALMAFMLRPRAIEVDTGMVVQGPIAEAVADQGVARVREAYIVSATVSGRLERVDLHVGDRIEAGRTVVARIRPAAPDLLDPRARAQAQAAVAAAQAATGAASAQRDRLAAEFRAADQRLARLRDLAGRGYATRQALDDATAAARAAAAAVSAADAEIRARRADLSAARSALIGPDAAGGEPVTVTSPASGYVTRVLQESERTVAMGAPLVEVSDNSGLEAAIEFLSQDAVRIREGMPAELYDWGGPGVLKGRVRRIEPQGFTKVSALGVEEQRVLVLIQLDHPPAAAAALGPGYRVWGRVILREAAKAVKVPLGALVREGGGWAVFRILDGRAALTPVDIGAMTDREAEVRSGLAVGQTVVIFPSDKVRGGVRVKARTPGALTAPPA